MAKNKFQTAEEYASAQIREIEARDMDARSERFREEEAFINSLFNKRGQVKTLRANTIGEFNDYHGWELDY